MTSYFNDQMHLPLFLNTTFLSLYFDYIYLNFNRTYYLHTNAIRKLFYVGKYFFITLTTNIFITIELPNIN